MKNLNILLITISLIFICQISFSQTKGKLKVIVNGLENNNGQVGINIFKQEKGFPSERSKAFKEYVVIPKNKQATFEINDFDFGVIAIVAIHDENKNNKLDKNFLGIPKEGFGASNNPKTKISAPTFSEAKFNFNKNDYSLTITLIYF